MDEDEYVVIKRKKKNPITDLFVGLVFAAIIVVALKMCAGG